MEQGGPSLLTMAVSRTSLSSLATVDLKTPFYLGGVNPLSKLTLSLQTPPNLVGSFDFIEMATPYPLFVL